MDMCGGLEEALNYAHNTVQGSSVMFIVRESSLNRNFLHKVTALACMMCYLYGNGFKNFSLIFILLYLFIPLAGYPLQRQTQ